MVVSQELGVRIRMRVLSQAWWTWEIGPKRGRVRFLDVDDSGRIHTGWPMRVKRRRRAIRTEIVRIILDT